MLDIPPLNGYAEGMLKVVTVPWLPFRARAMTLWPFILLTPGVVGDDCIMAHEMYHWKQQRSWGVIPWFIAYLIMGVFYIGKPADHHPMEREGYRIQRECEKTSDPYL